MSPARLPVRPRRLRWLVVLVPAFVVGCLEILSDSVLDEALRFPLDTILVTIAVLAISAVLAVFAFRRIDALTGALRAQNVELEARGASARALHRVSVALAAMTDVDHVLEAVVTHARELLATDVAILLLEGADGRPVLRAASGPIRAGEPPAPVAATSGSGDATTESPEPGIQADAILGFVDPAHAVARLAAPLQRGGQTIGLLAVGASIHRGFDADEVETLSSLANQATIALEHARLEARLRTLAVVEERERIARELHDGIAQVLGYVNTKSQAIDGFLASGRVDDARIQVAELGSAARAVYVDVREAILGLRSPIEPGQGLGAAIETHARRVAEASRFALDVAIPPDVRELRLDPEAEAQLYRIVQEALTNVRKHAAARRVRVAMAVADDRLELRIEDDGRGMAEAAAPSDVPRYGLRSMQERAAAIGAAIDIERGRQGGVAVRVGLPLGGHRREPRAAAGAGAGAGAGSAAASG